MEAMRISDNEVKKVLSGEYSIAHEITKIGEESEAAHREADQALVNQVTQSVIEMPDREEFIASLKARIEAGEYNPTGDEIADTMIRRSIADRIR
jgi:anti-sigma28 factor (negative regulator of flagellin synthesis)